MKLQLLTIDQQFWKLVIVKNQALHILFLITQSVFLEKSGINKYLVFCETKENKEILKNYTKIIDKIKDQILFITVDDFFVIGINFTRFRFKTDDRLPYNKKINVVVCVISISSVFEQKGRYYPHITLQDCFNDNEEYLILN